MPQLENSTLNDNIVQDIRVINTVLALNYCPWSPSFSFNTRKSLDCCFLFLRETVDLVRFSSPFQLPHVFVLVNSSYPFERDIVKQIEISRFIGQDHQRASCIHSFTPKLLGTSSLLHKAFHLSTCPMTRKRHMRAVSKAFS